MPIHTIPLGSWETNSHIIYQGDQAVVIDVGDSPEPILAFLEKNKLSLSHILLTHLHCDHLYGVASLQKISKAITLTPEKDEYLRGTPDSEGGFGWPIAKPFTSHFLPKSGVHSFGDIQLEILDTPGHTKGSVSFYSAKEKAVVSGDVLFHDGIGSVEFLGGDLPTLLSSIKSVLFSLPDETRVHAGHGPVTTISREKQQAYLK